MAAPAGPRDTSLVASQRYFELLRARTPAQRGRILTGLCEATRRLAELSIREIHPTATDRESRALLAARLYGPDIARRWFPLE